MIYLKGTKKLNLELAGHPYRQAFLKTRPIKLNNY